MDGPVLSAEALVVRYGRKEALKRVDLRFDGGSLGLLGPNGAGKSSLLRTLLGLIRPASGRSTVLGFDPAVRGTDVRTNTGYMPESDCHIPGLTGLEFVTFSGRLNGMDAAEAKRRAHEVLVYVGLDEQRYRPVDTYSRGMKQKAKLAAALVHDPAVIFLDEPTNGLDPQARTEVLDLIADLAHNKGINVVLSSHLLKDVEAVCSAVIVLAEGRVRAAGRIEELKHKGGGYVVKLHGDPGAFAERAAAAGLSVERDARGSLFVRGATGPNGADGGSPLEAAALFALAREAGTPLRHLTPAEESLEELFLRALEGE